MSRNNPISTLQRFHPAAFNPLETAEPTSEAFSKAPKAPKLVRREAQIRRDQDKHNGFSITDDSNPANQIIAEALNVKRSSLDMMARHIKHHLFRLDLFTERL